jgi:hypothetical protein
MFFFVTLSASAGMGQAKIMPQLPSPLDLAQVQAFLDRASFSVIAVCRPCHYTLLGDFSALFEVNFSITTSPVLIQYFEGFDLLLLHLVPITPYYAIFSYRKLGTRLDPIAVTTKIQKFFDLHIRRQQMQLDLLDGVIDKDQITFIFFSNQLRRLYKFTRLVPLSNVVGVSPSVFESLGVPAGECAVSRRDNEETVYFRCRSHNAIKHAKPSHMIADSVSRRRIVKSKLPIVAFCSRAT